MTTQRSLIALVVVALLLFIAGEAGAGPATDQLRSGVERVLRALADPALKNDARARRTEIRTIAEDFFDVRETAQRALGRHWQARTPAERDEFVRLFGDVLERAYLSKIELYGGEKIAFLGEVGDGEQATVRTKIVSKQGTEIPIDYRMLRRGDRWVVYDVLIEGVSLVANYRSQFNRLVVTSSYEGLVQALKAKAVAEEAEAKLPTAQR